MKTYILGFAHEKTFNLCVNEMSIKMLPILTLEIQLKNDYMLLELHIHNYFNMLF